MKAAPDVRIGIVAFDTADYLGPCLERLSEATSGLVVEVVVVDNGSPTTADADVARRFPVELVRLAENVGYARGMNVALADTRAPYLVALNPDTLPGAGSLRGLVEHLAREPDVGLVGPRLVGTDGSLQHSTHAFPSPAVALTTGFVPPRLRSGRLGRRMTLEGQVVMDRPSDVDWTVGAVHAVRRSALRREHAYSERSFMYAEDMEICWHLRQGGWRVVFDPSVEVVHVGNVSGAKTFGARRELRWLDATYDWYVAEHGAAAARRWAAANTAGLLNKLAVLSVTRRDPAHRAYVRELADLHRRRTVHPLGDLHSRDAPDGRPARSLVPVRQGDEATRSPERA